MYIKESEWCVNDKFATFISYLFFVVSASNNSDDIGDAMYIKII